MSVVLLVRHAQASFGSADYDVLSDLGERQAQRLGEALEDRGVTPAVVVTGRQVRQQETARLMLTTCGSNVRIDVDEGYDEYDHQALLDRPSYQDRLAALASTPASERPTRFQGILEDAIRRWVEGSDDGDAESFGEFRERVDRALRRTFDSLGAGQTAIVVTSGGPISAVATSLTDAPDATWLRLSPVLANTAISKVVSGRRGLSLVSFNEHGHLEGGYADLFSYR